MVTPEKESRIDSLLAMILAPVYRAFAPTRLAFAQYPALQSLRFVILPWQLLYAIGTLGFVAVLVRDARVWTASLPSGENPVLRTMLSGFVLIAAFVTGCVIPIRLLTLLRRAWSKASTIC